ncbi:MAG: carbohydrate ABC transporter permease [Ktedonobacterales bacterium]|nr:carbohydrate ABC transporter permease [Ktedonobacteraceae bacterium]MBA3823558.1 carbohydrate ABC transporter permease [Ktedonobacterales bacterium]
MNPLRSIRATVNNLLASGAGLIALVPIYLVFVNALKTQADASSLSTELPHNLQWGNVGTVIDQGNLVTAFFNSVLYSFGSTILAVFLAALAAYVLARLRTRRHEILYSLLILGIAVPTNFVTLTKVMQFTHLIDTQIGIILLYAATQIPFDVFLIYAFIGSVPKELDEAAFIDGCTPIRTFAFIILPLLTPVLVTCGILNILNVWNEFLMPLYFLNNSDNWPMTLSVYNFFGQYQSNWALVSADIMLTILPLFLIYIVAQRWILSGMSSGAVKG